jgi:glucose-1-phosphate cytidylyltransferase
MTIQTSHLVILAGGKGTRLGSLGKCCPKPAIQINGAPLVSYIIDWARGQSFKKIILAAGHLYEIVVESLQEHYGQEFQKIDKFTVVSRIDNACEIMVRDTGSDSLTGERLFAVKDLLHSQSHFVLTYSDTLTDMQMSSAISVANKHNALICMTAGFPDPRYGELLIEEEMVVAFHEKARPKFRINRGFFIMRKDIFSYWNEEDFRSLECDVLPHFAAQGQIVAYKSNDWFFSVDSEVDAAHLAEILS